MKDEITNTGKPAQQPAEQTPVDKTLNVVLHDGTTLERRRSLIKKGIVAVPTVITLQSGMAVAGSNCASNMASMNPDCP